MIVVYGIKNCNTVKKAINWLNEHEIPFEFHDFKKQGVRPEKLRTWSGQVNWEQLLNRRGTTWRRLDEAQKEKVKDEDTALDVLVANTSMIKRPVIEQQGKLVALGFDEDEYNQYFGR